MADLEGRITELQDGISESFAQHSRPNHRNGPRSIWGESVGNGRHQT
ncbi:hypothetical protein T4D_8712 [Trichinella pseudospiralis]|uniref:Uncharacterized protein n=1 Tax=Trichinella pseudospiralis TaxID=6337 RepID=A0A0V1DLF8_TRIPS|nr:hypothetical protein T4D_8712 [Trichinella pseudospiralis]